MLDFDADSDDDDDDEANAAAGDGVRCCKLDTFNISIHSKQSGG